MKKEKYRLAPLLLLKEKAKKQAEIVLAKAVKALAEEEEKLKRLKTAKEEVFRKIARTRLNWGDKVAAGQSRVKESHFQLGFLEKLKEDGEALDKEIKDQEEEIDRAKDKLKRARRDYRDAAYELNVMEKHKELCEKKQKVLLVAKENKIMNELGNVIYQLNKIRAE